MRTMRWRLNVTGWRYTRRWTIGVRRGEWWIGARYNLACDWLEIGVFGLTVAVPAEKARRSALRTTGT